MWKTCYNPYFTSICMPESKQNVQANVESELSSARWSVISFERCEASGLTYEQAAAKRAELERRKVTGLAVVTDEAAARLA
jgi:hypothetical protein